MMLNESNLHNYQLYTIEHILKTRRCGVFLEMGLGKTASTLTAVHKLIQRGEVRKVLVVAPKRVAQHTWTDEIQVWSHLQHLTASKVLGTKRQREKALGENTDIYIINIDNLPWLIDYLGHRWDFDMMVIDEYSCFKSGTTQRFKAMKRLLKARPQMRIVGLTGTPSPNSLEDLWSQLYILDGGQRLEPYITHFRQRYFTPAWGNGHIVYKWKLNEGAEDAIHDKIKDICVSMRSEDLLELPPVRYVNVPVYLEEQEAEEYRDFKRHSILSLEASEDVIADNAAILSDKLRQWLGGALYVDRTISDEYMVTNTAKLERLQEMLEEIHTPVIICYHYRHELDRLRKAFPKARTIDEPGVFDKWNRGEVPILLGQPQSMGHGLNLQKGGHTIIWYTLTWSLEHYQQMNARLARQGQTESVSIYHLITKGTIDERVLSALKAKNATQDTLMEAIKAELADFVSSGAL